MMLEFRSFFCKVSFLTTVGEARMLPISFAIRSLNFLSQGLLKSVVCCFIDVRNAGLCEDTTLQISGDLVKGNGWYRVVRSAEVKEE